MKVMPIRASDDHLLSLGIVSRLSLYIIELALEEFLFFLSIVSFPVSFICLFMWRSTRATVIISPTFADSFC